MLDARPGPHRQPAADAEVAVQPGVQPRPAVRLQRDHLPAGDEPVGVLLDPQVRAVGVAADDAERDAGVVAGLPGDQRAGARRRSSRPRGRPGVALGQFGEARGASVARAAVDADVERRRRGVDELTEALGASCHLSILTGVFADGRARVDSCPLRCRSPSRRRSRRQPSFWSPPSTTAARPRFTTRSAICPVWCAPSDSATRAKLLSLVTSIGSDAWDRLFSGPRPAELHPFVELDGPRHHAPSTPGDLLFHIKADVAGLLLRTGQAHPQRPWPARSPSSTRCRASSSSTTATCMGFVDGTENPAGAVAINATPIGDEDPDFAGGMLRARAEVPARHERLGRAARSASRNG